MSTSTVDSEDNMAGDHAGEPPEFSPEELAARLGQHAPTPEQSRIISSSLQPLLVVAGAGSGKTATMADRVVWLVANRKVRPEEILGVTFTRKAAGELAARIRSQLTRLAAQGLLPKDPLDEAAGLLEPTVSTYHAYANSLVADHGLRIGVERDAVLMGEAQAWQLAVRVVEAYAGDFEEAPAKSTLTQAVLQFAGECAEHLKTPDEAWKYLDAEVDRVAGLPYAQGTARVPVQGVKKLLNRLRTRMTVAELAGNYAEAKHGRALLDYGDLVSLAARIAGTMPQVRQLERARYKVVLLDEFQDTSFAQMKLFSGLFGDGHPVTAVGDPNQSIYGFRGASAGQLFDFRHNFPLVRPSGERAPAPALFLTVAWRNSVNILAMANAVSGPLNRMDPNRVRPGRIDVPPLRPREGAGPGTVQLFRFGSQQQEAAALAERVRRARLTIFSSDQESAGAEPASVAVLCRRRAQMPAIAQELDAAGIPYEIVGLGGLLRMPEIVDMVATLRVLADPSRSDSLMRILAGARWRIGPADLMAFADWSRSLMRRRERAAQHRTQPSTDSTASTDSPPVSQGDEESLPEADLTDNASLVEALDWLPEAGWTSSQGRSLTPEALRRLQLLQRELRTLRTYVGDDLSVLIGEVERTILLDIEVAAKPGTGIHQARRHLDAFQDAAAVFTQSASRVDLSAFLAWLEAAASEENGLDITPVDVRRDAVQILTVHAAKGLEWDAVFIPGLSEGIFPSGNASRWSSGEGSLPWPLRGDRADLPAWDTDQPDQRSWLESEATFADDCRTHSEQEERRLAYVAFTRAKHLLVCSSAAWTGVRVKTAAPSAFLTELLPLAEGPSPSAEVVSWVQEDELDADNPMTQDVESALWPYDPLEGPDILRGSGQVRHTGGRRSAMEQGAAAVLAALHGVRNRSGAGITEPRSPEGRRWNQEAELLLARHNAPQTTHTVALPAHISASTLVELQDDAAGVVRQLRRPVPREPGVAARRGTAFHAWVEEYYASAGRFDLDGYPTSADTHVDDAYGLAALAQAFRESPWARRQPVHIEVPIETRVGAVVVRGRIDAVFQDDDGTWELVDWKTGPVPSTAGLAVRSVQLAVYRLAWARLQGIALEQVRAAFHYVPDGVVVRPVDLADGEALEATVSAAYSG